MEVIQSAAYKWRLVNGTYIYLTDADETKNNGNGEPFIWRISDICANEELIKNKVSTFDEETYKNMFELMVVIAHNDPDGKYIQFLDYSIYLNDYTDCCETFAILPTDINITASAETVAYGEPANVTVVSCDTIVSENTKIRTFSMGFQIPQGEKGEKGDTGAGIQILSGITDISDLPSTGTTGEAYIINGNLYVWNSNINKFINAGNIQGPQGPKGDNGNNGTSMVLRGYLNNEGELPLDNNNVGDSYLINGRFYSWNGTKWIEGGSIIGPEGKQGNSATIKGAVGNVSDLPTHSRVNVGDCYLVQGILYSWDGKKWIKCGNIQGPQGVGITNVTNGTSEYIEESGITKNEIIFSLSDNTSKQIFIEAKRGNDGTSGIESITSIQPPDYSSNPSEYTVTTLTFKNNSKETFDVDIYVHNSDALIGSIQMWASNNIPNGYRLCNGDALNISEYPALYNILGKTYGGSETTFNLPNMQGMFVAGKGTGDYNTLGATGGANTVTLTVNQMPKHNHDSSTSTSDNKSVSTTGNGSHNHSLNLALGTYDANGSYADSYNNTKGSGTKLAVENAGSHTHTLEMYARGNGEAHENRPPYIVLNYIIKVK